MATPTRTREVVRWGFRPGGALELVGRNEAGEILGVHPNNLSTVSNLPAPVVDYLPRRPLWLAADIRDLAEERDQADR